MRSKDIHKKLKTALILSSIAAVLLIGTFLLFCACWSGAFHFLHPKEIATYNSPDGTYTLVFEQMGDPQWPFGATDVRLTLKNRDEKVLERVSAQLNDDGANAGTHNITAVFWNDDAVTVVLSASEMDDKEVSIPYKKQLTVTDKRCCILEKKHDQRIILSVGRVFAVVFCDHLRFFNLKLKSSLCSDTDVSSFSNCLIHL